jgi:hypothetical protein
VLRERRCCDFGQELAVAISRGAASRGPLLFKSQLVTKIGLLLRH